MVSLTQKVCDNMKLAHINKMELHKDLRIIRKWISSFKRDVSLRDALTDVDLDVEKIIPCKIYTSFDIDVLCVRGIKIPLKITVGAFLDKY